jgi:S1-C subfamily serine protease
LFRRFSGAERAAYWLGRHRGASGYILTNNHVVSRRRNRNRAHDGTRLLAQVVGADPETDLAVLRVKADKLPAISFGTSETLRVGDIVLAIGNPLGVGQTVTGGIVSAVDRSGLGINVFENFIQTDAAINQGNSGGALIDVQGNLVGINTAIYSRTGGSMGIGFAIPVSTARMVMDQIIKSGSVTRGWIGVELQEITPAIAESFKLADTRGAIIAGVLRGGPADKAGVKPGDVLVAIEGKLIVDPQSVLNAVTSIAPGRAATMKIKRKGQDLELAVTVGRRPKPPARPE